MQIRHGMNWILEVNREKPNDCFSICSCAKNLFTAADFSFESMTSSRVGQTCLSLTDTQDTKTLGQKMPQLMHSPCTHPGSEGPGAVIQTRDLL